METIVSTPAVFLDESYELGQIVLNSDVYAHYINTRAFLEQDEEAQLLIKQFIQKKEDYEEVERFGKYHPDYSRLTKEIRSVKREVDQNETIATFKKAEKELEQLLNDISAEIAGMISSTIKVPTGNPFFDQMSCGGGCGSGGSCGCS
ncbi:YlbF family regulator [Salsuginibacillus kocurii]|uniref:YlbF family regulator n=1 Tax=Salsuginibacillus kocurii TaxID=427078 RepID=UPI0003646C73|nr:YlbF family regulator [Salsuginibacillus kocurii]